MAQKTPQQISRNAADLASDLRQLETLVKLKAKQTNVPGGVELVNSIDATITNLNQLKNRLFATFGS